VKPGILQVQDLRVWYHTPRGPVKAVDGLSFALLPDERLGLVGESGSGKSTIALALMRLIRPPGKIESGEVWLDGVNVLELSEEQMRRLRLASIALAFRVARRLGGGVAGGLVAAACVALITDYGRFAANGYSEGLLAAFLLTGIELHLVGRRRAALTAGFCACLLRPEAWPFAGLYALWLARRDPAVRPAGPAPGGLALRLARLGGRLLELYDLAHVG